MGVFITFEGGDGSGKSTQIRLLQSYLEDRGRDCISTREPGGTSLGRLLRGALLESGPEAIGRPTELFLYLADRAQHVHEVIAPGVARGQIVLCDRYADSTLAYQGYGRGIDRQWLMELNEVATGHLKPDLTFLLDCPVELALSRTAHRKPGGRGAIVKDRLENERMEFHEKVRQGFLELARFEPERFCVLDASLSEGEVFAIIRQIGDATLRLTAQPMPR